MSLPHPFSHVPGRQAREMPISLVNLLDQTTYGGSKARLRLTANQQAEGLLTSVDLNRKVGKSQPYLALFVKLQLEEIHVSLCHASSFP